MSNKEVFSLFTLVWLGSLQYFCSYIKESLDINNQLTELQNTCYVEAMNAFIKQCPIQCDRNEYSLQSISARTKCLNDYQGRSELLIVVAIVGIATVCFLYYKLLKNL